MNTVNKWIEIGYEHFGLYGAENLNVKQMAKEASISRTSFNYYFKNKDEFINELLMYHLDLNTKYCGAAKAYCKNYLPDLHKMVLMYPIGYKFHKQLFNYRTISKYNDVFITCNKISAKEFVVQLFIDHYKLQITFEDAFKLHEALLTTWYSRIDFNDSNVFNLDYLVNTTDEIMTPLLKLVKSSK